ncbi:hypothetical protein Tco_0349674 [Tanacetum coccineum]
MMTIVNQGMSVESDCSERKNRNHENQTRGAGARGAVHALREGEKIKDTNNIKMRSKLKEKVPCRAECKLGSFDAIIGMDWLAKYQEVIVCAEKIVRIPWRNEILIIHSDVSNQGNLTRLNIISCTKTQKYIEKGFSIFLAHVTTKEVKDKSEKKRLEGIPIVRDFPEVFPEDLSGLPPTRQVEFQIDLVPWCAPVENSTGTLSIGALQNERVIGATERAIRQRLYKT